MEPISAANIAALTAGAASGVAEELKATNASADPELLGAAQSLLELIKALPQGGERKL